MHRIDTSGATADNRFRDGDPSGVPLSTLVNQDWLNAVQESICRTIEAAGISLVKGNDTQLLLAVKMLAMPVSTLWWTADITRTAAEILGFGTWQLIAGGRVPVTHDSTQTEFAAVGQAGGSKTNTISVNQMPSHTHQIGSRDSTATDGGNPLGEFVADYAYTAGNAGPKYTTSATGAGQPIDNMPPYIVVGRIWRRTA